jgi:hypothetical protein
MHLKHIWNMYISLWMKILNHIYTCFICVLCARSMCLSDTNLWKTNFMWLLLPKCGLKSLWWHGLRGTLLFKSWNTYSHDQSFNCSSKKLVVIHLNAFSFSCALVCRLVGGCFDRSSFTTSSPLHWWVPIHFCMLLTFICFNLLYYSCWFWNFSCVKYHYYSIPRLIVWILSINAINVLFLH